MYRMIVTFQHRGKVLRLYRTIFRCTTTISYSHPCVCIPGMKPNADKHLLVSDNIRIVRKAIGFEYDGARVIATLALLHPIQLPPRLF